METVLRIHCYVMSQKTYSCHLEQIIMQFQGELPSLSDAELRIKYFYDSEKTIIFKALVSSYIIVFKKLNFHPLMNKIARLSLGFV